MLRLSTNDYECQKTITVGNTRMGYVLLVSGARSQKGTRGRRAGHIKQDGCMDASRRPQVARLTARDRVTFEVAKAKEISPEETMTS